MLNKLRIGIIQIFLLFSNRYIVRTIRNEEIRDGRKTATLLLERIKIADNTQGKIIEFVFFVYLEMMFCNILFDLPFTNAKCENH